MKDDIKPFNPNYRISSDTIRLLMEIEAIKTEMKSIRLPVAIAEQIRQEVRVRSTHYSTQIEGNRLTLTETERAVKNRKVNFFGLERDAAEVRNYWNALVRVGEWAEKRVALSEEMIQKLHGLVLKGIRAGKTPYRTEQNVIKDSVTREIVYLPPEAKDVSALMGAMVAWANNSMKEKVPVPLVAGILHYQFATIHPYYDGNGRTARLLTSFLLYRESYGLNGLYSLEEYHAQDIQAYYSALRTHPHHNYYEGREIADLTGWVDYFIKTLAMAVENVRERAKQVGEVPAAKGISKRPIDPRKQRVMALFAEKDKITTNEVAAILSLSSRMARLIVKGWIEDGWIVMSDKSKKGRTYILKRKHS